MSHGPKYTAKVFNEKAIIEHIMLRHSAGQEIFAKLIHITVYRFDNKEHEKWE